MPTNWLKPFVLDNATSTSPGSDIPVTPSSTASAAFWGAAAPAETSTTANITGFQRAQSCTKSSQCPESAPCCSEEGFCGTGRNCLAGCDPLASFSPGACAPVPACVGGEVRAPSLPVFLPRGADDGSGADDPYDVTQYQLKEVNRILANSSTWNGDATAYDWLVDKRASSSLSLFFPALLSSHVLTQCDPRCAQSATRTSAS